MNWLMDVDGDPTKIAMIVSLVIVMIASTLSALSGVGKGIKWLSNINMGLSFFMLAFFLVFGSTLFALSALFVGLWDYVINLPMMILTVWSAVGRVAGQSFIGRGGSPSRRLSVCFWPVFRRDAQFGNMFWVR